ncbi:nucleoside diphosphate kinase regulator [Pseudidiomarina mangrovi]|uniref:nucleoside diphosphate kinase regulator n=1 Tax=Pseudidiomarina mangrovi TaxID=2487133 RepID=UPI000FC9FAC6|nr:nucleoside diphosphate kinase regulator [Pseudidiomarina mangrovi]
MADLPEIILSELDVARIETLIERMRGSKDDYRKLEAELARGRIVAPQAIPANVVTMNSRVQFKIQQSGKVFEKTLVYPKDLSTSSDTISILAPIGSSLLGLQIGQHIEWPMPGGSVTVEIVDIPYQPERSGDFAA